FPYNMKVAEAKQDWMRMLIKYEPQNLEWYTPRCVETPRLLSLVMASVSQVYDVEDFIVLDLDYGTHKKARLEYNKNYYIRKCPYWLKKDVQYERSVLKRAEESLLSSPVSCHATSFYPNRAPPLRRKDGDDLHENVDHGEILPNPDGTFQMSVDLNLSSVKPEDWGKYDCLFQMFTSCEEYLSFTENKQLTIVLLLSLQFLQLSTSSSSSSPIVHRKLNNDFLRVFVRLLASHM
uniref:Ig-like domain-containing protein n=1 Tax=Mola mola TaxID=94237 RepID=A0A3Q4B5R9_MOLML